MRALKVALPLPVEPMSYTPPHAGKQGDLAPQGRDALGYRVVVPWRGELRVGLVVGSEEGQHKSFALREAIAYLDTRPWLSPAAIELLTMAARDSFCTVGTLLDDLIPFLEPPLLHRVRLLPEADPVVLPKGLEALALDWQEARGFDPRLLDYLREAGVLQEEVAPRRSVRQALMVLREPVEKLSEKARSAWYALHDLRQVESMAALARAAGVGTGVVKGLMDKGYIGFVEVDPVSETVVARKLEPLELPTLPVRLQGGRLLERIRALATLAQTESVMVLFPEVSLLKKFQPYFPEAIVFHGEMKAEERRTVWEGVSRGELERESGGAGDKEKGRISVLCTYQGLLLPVEVRRMAVVEEASEAYKLPAGSRAFVPRLAQLKAQQLGIPLHYWSGINSAEVWAQPALALPIPPPRPHLLDMRQERGWPLSGAALALLKQSLEKKRQAIVLSARRGYSAMLRCKQCDWKAMCPNCALPLRLHKSERLGSLHCHQCGHEQKAPDLCPNCQSDVFDPRGPGVEWLLEALHQQIPALPRYRYTADAKDNLGKLLAGEPGVLVGTTAILRGPVLPELALVLLPYADGFVLESDFRASERYHRLLWQLTDLHPRRRPLLVLQTFEPGHAAHRALQTADPQGFMEVELALRHTLGYPPATRMVKLEVAHPKEPVARDAIYQLAEALRPRAQPGELLGPAPAPVARLRGQYVFHLLLKSSEARLQTLMENLPPVRGARLRLDPDPQSFVGLLED
ncbi:primosomal protein N' [uncultured Meiothermus sp.]|jgi:primosomal protein N' (replication factor Y)|uniref:primosomal protein N' family DNA-binding protein n=1 Tax=uncultured Meiothermus sp. TaxID=157471 RepID=UPI002622A9E4|nr:primosomal protein N' [uncultured Meiothermus sp.]